MRNAKVWLIVAIVAVALGITTLEMTRSSAGASQEMGFKTHWRFHDGHWCLYDESDRRWYYTEGSHWYYENGGRWNLYRFDGKFGRDFERGDYRPPAVEVKVAVPTHGVFIRK